MGREGRVEEEGKIRLEGDNDKMGSGIGGNKGDFRGGKWGEDMEDMGRGPRVEQLR